MAAYNVYNTLLYYMSALAYVTLCRKYETCDYRRRMPCKKRPLPHIAARFVLLIIQEAPDHKPPFPGSSSGVTSDCLPAKSKRTPLLLLSAESKLAFPLLLQLQKFADIGSARCKLFNIFALDFFQRLKTFIRWSISSA